MLSNVSYLPKDKEANVDVYITNRPTNEYIEFALIRCRDTNEKWCLEQIRNAARETGADAIIIIDKVGAAGLGYIYTYNQGYGMIAVAIKYK
ncbi:MAG: hypothetical protein LBR17_04545 [Bacteroidales bacterium]|nr:hypothetical protein [Bacteroidales bacterium]